MNQTTVDAPAVVGVGVLDSQAVSIARDLLAGYSGDYIFFGYSSSEYVLAKCDSISFNGNSFVLPASDWYSIYIDSSSHSVSVSEGGSVSGSFGGANTAGGFSGSYSGSFDLTVIDPPVYHLYYYYDDDGLEVANPNSYIVYSSIKGMPHLIDGGDYYAFAQTAILCCVCLFLLISRIFKHVS